ncbi:MAG: hypothetical protein ACREMX_09085 [Gemmatimonadales bacterium]
MARPRFQRGRTAFRLVNQGAEPHHLVVLRLEEGRTFDSLLAALKKPGPPPSWIRAVGGPNAAAPGGESNTEQVLTAGHYAVICFVPSPDGAPHLAKGMVNSLEVTPASGPVAAETPADIVLKLSDYSFSLSAPLSPGKRVVRVENTGSQLHEIVLAKLAPGRSATELVAWELGGRKGEAPGTFVGGMAPMERGEQALFSATFEPGEYALICFVPDAKDGKPHTAHGMVKQIKVG